MDENESTSKRGNTLNEDEREIAMVKVYGRRLERPGDIDCNHCPIRKLVV